MLEQQQQSQNKMIQAESRTFGELRCRIVQSDELGQKPRAVFVLCHGFGAPGDDLVDVGGWLLQKSSLLQSSFSFVFPEAPIDMTPMSLPGGRAWWPINMARLAEINQTQNYDELTNLTPDGMDTATNQLAAALKEIQQHFGVADSQTVMGGFSQGAMVSTNVVLQHGICPAHLVLFSGTLLCHDNWRQLAEKHAGCPVFQTHGTSDPVLPFGPAEKLRDMLNETGFQTVFQPFDGPHTIPMTPLADVTQLLEQIAEN